MKKIGIDGRLLGLEHAGIGRYTENLVNHLKLIDHKNIYYLFLRKKYFSKLELPENWIKIPVEINHYSLSEQILLPSIIQKYKLDLVHFPNFNVPFLFKGSYVLTIHDLIKHNSRGSETTTRSPYLYWLKYFGYRYIFSHAVKKASKIITPSFTVKNELIRQYNLEEEKICPIYEGFESKFQKTENRNETEMILKKYMIERPFVIYTGSVYPHKNIRRLITAVKQITCQDLKLVISCSRNIFLNRLNEEIIKLKAKDKVILAGFIPDDELAQIYQASQAYIFPSLSEGFGLTGIEAMAAGLPVVCSDIPVFREIYNDAVLYFDPYDVNDMVQKITEIINHKSLRAKLIRNGKEAIKRYSWQQMVQNTLKIYEET